MEWEFCYMQQEQSPISIYRGFLKVLYSDSHYEDKTRGTVLSSGWEFL